MDFKDVIEELLAGENDATVSNGLSKACGLAAEALALVAWAETNDLWISRANGEVIVNLPFGRKFRGKSLLGCIRAAKEAYEAQ